MDTWESIPSLAVDVVIKGVKNMEILREKPLDELIVYGGIGKDADFVL